MSPQELIKSQRCGSAVKLSSSCSIQIQFSVPAWGLLFLPELFFFREYLLPLPAFLMCTELHASKNNIPYEIKVNKHYLKIINDLEILHRTQETIQERE